MFSIVIPLYNKSHTIVNTIQTVLNQTFSEYEILIVNDGSNDNGVAKIQNRFSDERIRIINQHNQGVSSARNRGVEESKNELIAFLDGDDEWLPEYLSKMKESVSLFPEAGMYCCAGFLKYPDGSSGLRASKRYGDKIQLVNCFDNPYFFFNSSATVVRKSVFKKTDGFPIGMKINEDLVLFCSLSLIAPVAYCPIPLSVYLKEVKGHASAPNPNVHEYVASRVNQIFTNWNKTNKSNKTFITFTKYEVRSMMLIYIKNREYAKIRYLLENLDEGFLDNFSFIELKLLRVGWLHSVLMLYIYATKIIWRLGGYPVLKYSKK